MTDKHSLRWAGSTVECSLPEIITRVYVQTPDGPLELLVAQPPPSVQPRKKAILFQHGGFGSAAVWIPFITYFSLKGHPCYAVSLRGHGASWQPRFLTLLLGTGKAAMARDLGYTLNWVQGYEAGQRQGCLDLMDIVLVGHSAGGGLSQYFLSRSLGKVGGLVLMGAFPNFGGLGVYWNWFKLDPWFPLRMYFRDFGHPRSPLSSTTLVHRAFFSPSYPTALVQKFESYMPEYESLLWPLGMMFPFVNVRNVLKNIVGWGPAITGRLFILAGSEDTLMSVKLMRRMAQQYRNAFGYLTKHEQLFPQHSSGIEGVGGVPTDAVKFSIVQGAGHHMQNDLQWEDSASQLLRFVEQL